MSDPLASDATGDNSESTAEAAPEELFSVPPPLLTKRNDGVPANVPSTTLSTSRLHDSDGDVEGASSSSANQHIGHSSSTEEGEGHNDVDDGEEAVRRATANASVALQPSGLASFVDNVQVGVGITLWVVGLVWKALLSSWVILVVYPITWVVYGVWRNDEDRGRVDDDVGATNMTGTDGVAAAGGDALHRRGASPFNEGSDAGPDDATSSSSNHNNLGATALDNATGGGGMAITRSPSKGQSPMPSSSSFGQLDSFAAGGANGSSGITAAEMTRAARLRMTMNERLRGSGASFCAEMPLSVHVATWNVAQQLPPSSEGGIYGLRRWLLGDALCDVLEEAAKSSASGGGEAPPPLSLFPDVVVVGLQEVEFGGIALMVETTESSVAWTEAVTDCLNDAVQWRVRYKKLRTVQLVGIVLIVVVRASHEPFVTHVRTSLARTGAISGVMGNKGSIGLRMTLYGKRFLFVCAHFHPHLNNATTRMKNYHNALSSLTFELSRDADDEFDVVRLFDEAFVRAAARRQQRRQGDGPTSATTTRVSSRTEGQSAWSRFFSLRARRDDAVLKELRVLESHDYVFFFGDLNYRLHGLKGDLIRKQLPAIPLASHELTAASPTSSMASGSSRRNSIDTSDAAAARDTVHQWEQQYRNTIADMILKHDELATGMYHRKIFNGFEEAAITFPPTYKYDIGTCRYDSSSKRREPAWTDRILFRVWDEANPMLGDQLTEEADMASAAFHGHEGTISNDSNLGNTSPGVAALGTPPLTRSSAAMPTDAGRIKATSLPSVLRKVLSTTKLLKRSFGGTPAKARGAADAPQFSQTPVDQSTPLLLDSSDDVVAVPGGVAATPIALASSSLSPFDVDGATPPLVQLLDDNTGDDVQGVLKPSNSDGCLAGGATPTIPRAAVLLASSAPTCGRSSHHHRTLSGGSDGGGFGNGSSSAFPVLGSAAASTTGLVAVKSAPFSNVVPNGLTACGYRSIQSLSLSDHKPVLAVFRVTVVSMSEKQAQAAMNSCRDLWDSGHCEVDAHLT